MQMKAGALCSCSTGLGSSVGSGSRQPSPLLAPPPGLALLGDVAMRSWPLGPSSAAPELAPNQAWGPLGPCDEGRIVPSAGPALPKQETLQNPHLGAPMSVSLNCNARSVPLHTGPLFITPARAPDHALSLQTILGASLNFSPYQGHLCSNYKLAPNAKNERKYEEGIKRKQARKRTILSASRLGCCCCITVWRLHVQSWEDARVFGSLARSDTSCMLTH